MYFIHSPIYLSSQGKFDGKLKKLKTNFLKITTYASLNNLKITLSKL